ncbi:hypothetical protein Pan44_17790 [Caulifigura coniformis]|uniref:Uncharacterized protein n=1 Tax=Caulifigura coniformis TaxID=2527983 RepID=A0A517SCD5_9PLAN|nr:hypothetical protein [Caulifigura coniformis]QDT53756.1 hypothetical protein Pan44_17790 [Caulifigura coniformis]
MDAGQGWRHVFKSWPAGYPKSGLLITTFQETIPFCNFLLSEQILLLERDKPDAQGARKAMVAFSAIAGLKLLDVFELSKFQAFGFEPPGK